MVVVELTHSMIDPCLKNISQQEEILTFCLVCISTRMVVCLPTLYHVFDLAIVDAILVSTLSRRLEKIEEEMIHQIMDKHRF